MAQNDPRRYYNGVNEDDHNDDDDNDDTDDGVDYDDDDVTMIMQHNRGMAAADPQKKSELEIARGPNSE